MSDFKVGQHVTVKLSGGRLVDAEIKAIIETAEDAIAGFVWRRDGPDLPLAGCREAAITLATGTAPWKKQWSSLSNLTLHPLALADDCCAKANALGFTPRVVSVGG